MEKVNILREWFSFRYILRRKITKSDCIRKLKWEFGQEMVGDHIEGALFSMLQVEEHHWHAMKLEMFDGLFLPWLFNPQEYSHSCLRNMMWDLIAEIWLQRDFLISTVRCLKRWLSMYHLYFLQVLDNLATCFVCTKCEILLCVEDWKKSCFKCQ